MLRSHAAVLVALVLLVLGAISCGANETPRPPDKANRLREAVTAEGVMQHARRFAEIAEENGGNRAAGTPGYDASAEYVADTLRAAGYEVTVQPFEFPYFEELEPARLELVSPERRSYTPGREVKVLQYSGSGEVTAPIRPVDFGDLGTSASGCEASDFEGFREGDAVLLRRGVCPFGQKAENAEAAGASAAVITGEEDEPFSGTLGGPGTDIPVLATSSAVGEELARLAGDGGATVRVVASTRSENRETSNVVAETRTGRADRTVMVGAHLDSVPEGPGINDNGSGTSTILEIAEEMDELGIEPENKLRFAFWGAEELGLLGSTRYAEGLSEREAEEIEAYLNFDMLGSANGVRFVYDDAGNPSGSDRVEDAFLDYFASRDLEAEPDDTLVGRSDHGPFADRGIPVGGLFSGAEGRKTRGEAEDYGGEAGEAHDPCYHQACDDLDNLDPRLLDQMADAAADATLRFAEGSE
jgi:Zn-dependent M28 family amino/carboxypeptidase